MKSRHAPCLIMLAIISACVGPPSGHQTSHTPAKSRPPIATTADMKQCTGDLARLSARYTILPNRNFGEGCSAINSVLLAGVGIPITNVSAIQCPLARALAQWTQGAVQPAARAAFGARVVKIETMGAYSCRNVIGGRGTGRSEHASANAVDVSAFILSDGRRVSIAGGWNGDNDEQEFLREIRGAACKRFQTVLSPEYNAAHHDHLHFDMGRGPYCR
jgi:hypothetical protein